MPRYKCKWFRGSCSKCASKPPTSSVRGEYVIPQFYSSGVYWECTGSRSHLSAFHWQSRLVNFSSTQSFGDTVMYIDHTIQIHTKMKSSYSVLPLSYIINFCIFMSVCCFSNGAYLLVLVIELICLFE